MLITLWFGLVVWWWFAYCYCFWCSGDVIVIHWLTNEVTLVAGWCWVNRETRIRSDWGGGCLFDVNHGIWVNRVTLTLPAGRGSW